jgi:predicted nucleic acid-binding protein
LSAGVTLDTGALIALERRHARALRLLRGAQVRQLPVTVPVAVIAEWWRGRTDRREAIVGALLVEPMTHRLARVAGEALAAVSGASTVDAIVMASAAIRGDVVLTGDPEDLLRLADGFFHGVRVLAV